MKEKKKFGYLSQGYEAPRAESFETGNEGILCASDPITGNNIEEITTGGSFNWDGTGGGTPQP
ncbi:MAG: hypothetical protein KBT57_08550 [bacterium]|nr:hypothetical protein [Candidatus Limimorpha equi]